MNVIDLLVLFCTPSCLAVGIIQSYEDVVRIIQAAEVAYPEYDDGTHATKMRKVSHDLISREKKKILENYHWRTGGEAPWRQGIRSS